MAHQPYQIRVGSDIVQISRFRKILARSRGVSERIFLPRELDGASLESLAGIFAAKEAVIKALGLRAGDWLKIEIKKPKTSSRPRIQLSKPPKTVASYDLSVTHDGDYAAAVAAFLIHAQ